jgi:hypothetical protein
MHGEKDEELWRDAVQVPGFGYDRRGLWTALYDVDVLSGNAVLEQDYISDSPVWVSSISYCFDTKKALIHIEYVVPGDSVNGVTIGRDLLYGGSLDKELGKYHRFPVRPSRMKLLKKYIEEAEKECTCVEKFRNKAGWVVDGGKHKFVLYGRNGILIKPEAGELERMYSGLRQSGEREKQLEAVFETLRRNPLVSVLIAAAVATPLLERIGGESSVIDIHSLSSAGKTVSAACAISLYGNPEKLIIRWDGTPKGIEEKFNFCDGIPCHLDEATSVRDKRHITEIVYDAANGVGRERAKAGGGSINTGSWNTIVFSTSESSLQQLIGMAISGLDARIFPVEGQILRGYSASEVEDLSATLRKNHGWIGRDLLTYLEDDVDFKSLGEKLDEYTLMLADSVDEKDRIQRRKARKYAVFFCAVDVLQALYPEYVDVIAEVHDNLLKHWQFLCDSRSESDVAQKALTALFNYYNQRTTHFDGSSKACKGSYIGDGETDNNSADGSFYKNHLGFFEDVFTDILLKAGFKVDNCLEELSERRWILFSTSPITGKKNFKTRTTINGEGKKLIVISREGRHAYDNDFK